MWVITWFSLIYPILYKLCIPSNNQSRHKFSLPILTIISFYDLVKDFHINKQWRVNRDHQKEELSKSIPNVSFCFLESFFFWIVWKEAGFIGLAGKVRFRNWWICSISVKRASLQKPVKIDYLNALVISKFQSDLTIWIIQYEPYSYS